MDAVVLGLRVLLSLAVVLGLLWYLQRKVARFNRMGSRNDPVTVVTRQGISPKASVVLIEAEGRRFLLGVTDQSVNVLHTSEAPGLAAVPALEHDDEVSFARVLNLATAGPQEPSQTVMAGPAGSRRSGRRAALPARPASPLAGSILSPDTWRQTASAFRQGRAG